MKCDPFMVHIYFYCLVIIYGSCLLMNILVRDTVKVSFLANLNMISSAYRKIFAVLKGVRFSRKGFHKGKFYLLKTFHTAVGATLHFSAVKLIQQFKNTTVQGFQTVKNIIAHPGIDVLVGFVDQPFYRRFVFRMNRACGCQFCVIVQPPLQRSLVKRWFM